MWCSPLKGYGIFAEHFYWLPLVFFNFLSLKIRLSLKKKSDFIQCLNQMTQCKTQAKFVATFMACAQPQLIHTF